LISQNTAHDEGQSTYPKAATLVFDHVQKRYPGAGEPAIHDLSFEVPAGRICVLVGPSGCGKTTAMRLVNRMIELTSGDILLDGRSVRDRDPAELRRGIGYAIQQIGLFPHRTVAENIVTVPRLLGWDKARMAARVEELLDLLSLDHDLRDRYPSQLSGGQRQRVGVARALAADPPLLLMDEPFGAVDPIARVRIQGEFLELQRRIEKTVLFVTHDIDEAIRLGDRVAMLRVGGRVAQYGSPQELLMRPADDFVADFVGADRALKRLSLMAAAEMDLEPVPPGTDDLLSVDARTPVRTALSEMLEADTEEAVVVRDGGEPLGRLTVDAIGRRLEAERTGERAIP
jgi:osmoprotectant transport system ATP-binding protein